MQGFWNHCVLENADFIGKGILYGYGLYDVSSFPGIIKREDGAVKGEIYGIDDPILKRLDRLEGEGSLYIRERGTIFMDNGSLVEAFVYVWNRDVNEMSYRPIETLPWR